MNKKAFLPAVVFLLFAMWFSYGQKTPEKTASEKDTVFSPAGFVAEGCWYFYKAFITDQDASNCPYSLSCSRYMVDSIYESGIPGIVKGFDRLNRCTRYENRRQLYYIDDDFKYVDNPGDLKLQKVQLQDYLLKLEAKGMASPQLKSRTTATVLSVFIPGAGQLYLGNYGRAARSFLTTGAFAGAAVYCTQKYGAKNWRPWVYGSVAAGNWIVDIYGANTSALRKNWSKLAHEAEALQDMALQEDDSAAEEWEPDGGTRPDLRQLVVFQLEQENWSSAEDSFRQLALEQSFTPEQTALFEDSLNSARLFEGKSENLAMILSLIPGIGQLYAHQWRDGINAFVLNGALAAVTVFSLVSGDFVDFIFLELNPDLRFFRGNLINARRDVRIYNNLQRQKILFPVYEMLH